MLNCCRQIALGSKKRQTALFNILLAAKMKLNQASINKILKDSVDVVVYGLESCKYLEVHDALSALNIKSHIADEYGLPLAIPFIPNRERSTNNSKQIIGDECKHLIVNLIIENYKRWREGRPIAPLLFCVAIEDDLRHQELSIDCLFAVNSLIANKELRRCYRIYAETTPDIRIIARETFKFVHVKQNPHDKEEYSLEEVPPFWEKEGFNHQWQTRMSDPNRPSQVNARMHPKKYKWKSELLSAVGLFNISKAKSNMFHLEGCPNLRARL